jgi:hypothetical protein
VRGIDAGAIDNWLRISRQMNFPARLVDNDGYVLSILGEISLIHYVSRQQNPNSRYSSFVVHFKTILGVVANSVQIFDWALSRIPTGMK